MSPIAPRPFSPSPHLLLLLAGLPLLLGYPYAACFACILRLGQMRWQRPLISLRYARDTLVVDRDLGGVCSLAYADV